MGVNSLPETVTGQRSVCDLNPGPYAPESSTLTTRLTIVAELKDQTFLETKTLLSVSVFLCFVSINTTRLYVPFSRAL